MVSAEEKQKNEPPTLSELETALKVFQFYLAYPEAKREAATNPAIQSLFSAATSALYPDRLQRKSRRDIVKKERKCEDQELLQKSVIRTNRKNLKLVGQAVGGSQLLEYSRPPRVGSLDANEAFILKDDCDSIREKTLQALSAGALQDCSAFNHSKRVSTADLTGKIILVTGARVKIGYCTALKLLRMNCTVIVTTRFPHDAALRYAKEEDFDTFKGRLFIYGLDFRDLKALHQFCDQLRASFTHLDALVNNAAQTVRRGPGYYAHLLPGERSPVPEEILNVVSVVDVYKFGNNVKFLEQETASTTLENDCMSLSTASSASHTTPMPALLSQTKLIPSDENPNLEAQYPTGFLDRDDQQIDLQRNNSWTIALSEISTIEMVECTAINTFAPFILCNELVSMMRQVDASERRFIVNVSAMEGQFYRKKTHDHPHTNMAKAAFNMLTRTSAGGLMKENIFMTSVDTGWITDEKPVDQWVQRELQPPPLDEVDAAMRILDPIIDGFNDGVPMWGVFLKNYFPTRW